MKTILDGLSHRVTRRDFVTRSSLTLAGAALLPKRYAFGDTPKPEFVEVDTAYGRLRGAKGDGLTTFKGIPYAGPDSGANRFKAAPPLAPWAGVRDALELGAPAMQPGGQRRNEPPSDENCLFLNVWTPAADGRKRPVMLYSHGGGFTSGSGGAGYQDGGNLARTWDVVVVATNHRLGLFGYLFLGDLGGEEYATSGNQGLLDICDGLKWIHGNIAAFGGDPNNMMIFGESGGGAKTSCLYAMPAAEPYFNKASIESGPGIRMTPREVAAETTLMTLKQLGIEKSDWRKLLDVPADKLVEVQVELGKRPGGPLTMSGGRKGIGGGGRPGGFGPVVDGAVLPNHPFDPEAPAISKNKPLIVGSNRDETNFFFMQSHATDVYELTDATLKERLQKELGANADAVLDAYRKSRPDASAPDLYVAISTAQMIGLGAITIAERKYAQHGAPVYMYIFTHGSDMLIPGTQHKLGAAHALEIPYKFNLVQPPNASQTASGHGPDMMGISDPASIKAAHNMSGMWARFARTGHPGVEGQPVWPAYDLNKRATMEIDTECKVVDDPYPLERSVWEKLEP